MKKYAPWAASGIAALLLTLLLTVTVSAQNSPVQSSFEILNNGAYEGTNVVPRVVFTNTTGQPVAIEGYMKITGDWQVFNGFPYPPYVEGGMLAVKCRSAQVTCWYTYTHELPAFATSSFEIPRETGATSAGFYPGAVSWSKTINGQLQPAVAADVEVTARIESAWLTPEWNQTTETLTMTLALGEWQYPQDFNGGIVSFKRKDGTTGEFPPNIWQPNAQLYQWVQPIADDIEVIWINGQATVVPESSGVWVRHDQQLHRVQQTGWNMILDVSTISLTITSTQKLDFRRTMTNEGTISKYEFFLTTPITGVVTGGSGYLAPSFATQLSLYIQGEKMKPGTYASYWIVRETYETPFPIDQSEPITIPVQITVLAADEPTVHPFLDSVTPPFRGLFEIVTLTGKDFVQSVPLTDVVVLVSPVITGTEDPSFEFSCTDIGVTCTDSQINFRLRATTPKRVLYNFQVVRDGISSNVRDYLTGPVYNYADFISPRPPFAGGQDFSWHIVNTNTVPISQTLITTVEVIYPFYLVNGEFEVTTNFGVVTREVVTETQSVMAASSMDEYGRYSLFENLEAMGEVSASQTVSYTRYLWTNAPGELVAPNQRVEMTLTGTLLNQDMIIPGIAVSYQNGDGSAGGFYQVIKQEVISLYLPLIQR